MLLKRQPQMRIAIRGFLRRDAMTVDIAAHTMPECGEAVECHDIDRLLAVLRRRAEAQALAAQVAQLEARLPSSEDASPDSGAASPQLHFDEPARRAWFAGQLLDLRPREYDLLHFLAQHRGQVLSRVTLLDQVWGQAEYIDDRTVDVHVHRLRHKLAEIAPAADPIQTERGVGYRFDGPR